MTDETLQVGSARDIVLMKAIWYLIRIVFPVGGPQNWRHADKAKLESKIH